MARPQTVLTEAEKVHGDLLSHPRGGAGAIIDRKAFERMLVAGYRKSLDAARRITETGEAAGLWTVHRNPQARNGGKWHVEIHAAAQTSPGTTP